MANGSAIEWTEATWNPVSGCTRASSGCDNCYAVTMTHRLAAMGQTKYAGLTVLNPRGDRHFNGKVRCHDDALQIPLRWKKPRRIFVNSMSDLFHKDVPFEFIDRVFAVMALTPQHTYQVLTKRPDRMAEYLNGPDRPKFIADEAWAMQHAPDVDVDCSDTPDLNGWPLANVWLGTSVENQQAADERIPHLLRCPAAVRFLSCEPLLGPVDLSGTNDDGPNGGHAWLDCPGHSSSSCRHHKPDWVIVGGESGGGARPCNIEWIRDIVAQCKAAGVPVFVKQLGANPVYTCNDPAAASPDYPINLKDPKGGDPAEWDADLRERQFPQQKASV